MSSASSARHPFVVADKQLIGVAQAFLGHDRTVVGAFSAITGARPGIEALLMIPSLIVAEVLKGVFDLDGILWSAVLGGVAGGGMTIVAVTRRRSVTVAATQNEVVVLNNRGRSWKHPRTATTFPWSAVRFDDTGVRSVWIHGVRYWVGGSHEDEARRLVGTGPR